MRVCPKCGLPFPTQVLFGPTKCSYCGWEGDSSDLFTVQDDGKFQDEDLQKLREVFVYLASEISPLILRKLIQVGIFKASNTELKVMVPLIASVTRAMFSALVQNLCGSEIDNGGEVGRTVHP